MRIKRIVLFNRAPFEKLDLDFTGKQIISLTGINGSGKTTLLSYIVDALYEMAKKAYSNEFSGDKEGKYYRVCSALYNISLNSCSLIYICFEHDGEEIKYIDYYGESDENAYNQAISEIDGCPPFSEIKNRLNGSNSVKYVSCSNDKLKEKIKDVFSKGIQTYFPAYRYEQPGYLSDIYRVELDFKKKTEVAGYLTNPIEVTSDLPGVANWIMDIVLDRELYNSTEPLQQINRIVSEILSCKINKPVRLGIGQRHLGGARIQIVERETGRQVYPSIFNISSGEAALLCIFVELLKQIDRVKTGEDDVEGIVLIDEIDKHLHIRLQKEVLPVLINEFPNIQFVITTHSAFVNMGIADLYRNRSIVFDLDRGGIESEADQNEVFREAYEVMVEENQRYADSYSLLCEKIKVDTLPLIITEGSTDWRHMKAAREALKNHPECAGWLPYLQFEFLEYDDENSKSERVLKISMGDKALVSMCESISKIPYNSRKMIFISDRDNPDKTKALKSEGLFKSWGHNVYSLWIPLPEHRKETPLISIEHYYPDAQIKQEVEFEDGQKRRLYMGYEFDRFGLNNTEKKFCPNKNICGPSNIKIIDGNGDNKVFFMDNEECNLALSKMQFAEKILNKEAPFDHMDFTGFIPLFKAIRGILETETQTSKILDYS